MILSKIENFARVRDLRSGTFPTKPLNPNSGNLDAENEDLNLQNSIKTCVKLGFSSEIIEILNFVKIQNFCRVGDLEMETFPAKPLNPEINARTKIWCQKMKNP